jgi:uncharacterized protein YceK
MRKYILLVLILFIFNGCMGTLSSFNEPKLYSATRGEINALYNAPYLGGENTLPTAIYIIDLPFSLVFDTILIPYKTYLIINEDDNVSVKKESKR